MSTVHSQMADTSRNSSHLILMTYEVNNITGLVLLVKKQLREVEGLVQEHGLMKNVKI